MRVNLGVFAHNSEDWDRFQSRNFDHAPATPDCECVEAGLAIGDLAEPEEVIKRIVAAQQNCSFSEITIVSQFGTMPHDEAQKSMKLFAREVLPVVHQMGALLHPADFRSLTRQTDEVHV
jgi:hypothetical protein